MVVIVYLGRYNFIHRRHAHVYTFPNEYMLRDYAFAGEYVQCVTCLHACLFRWTRIDKAWGEDPPLHAECVSRTSITRRVLAARNRRLSESKLFFKLSHWRWKHWRMNPRRSAVEDNRHAALRTLHTVYWRRKGGCEGGGGDGSRPRLVGPGLICDHTLHRRSFYQSPMTLHE